MTEEIMTQFRTEGQPAFPKTDTENDNSAASSTGEKTATEQTQSQEGEQNSGAKKDDGAENFADHPRWKEREANWTQRFNSQEERHVQEIAKLREEIVGKIQSNGNVANKTNNEIPEWFGGDETTWSKYSEHTNKLIDQAVEKALSIVNSKNTEEQKKIDEATKYMNDQLSEIETDQSLNPNGEKIDRPKLLKFVLDNELVDTKGRWNYKAAFRIMKAEDVFKAKSALNDRKQIAGATTSNNKSETKPAAFLTNQDFAKPENRPW